MKNINEISPIIRDELLVQNIGKYNQIEQRMIYPIGLPIDIYNSTPIKTESIIPNGLLDYLNGKKSINSRGELSEEIFLPSIFVRGNESIDLDYSQVKEQKYSYLDGYTYHDPKDKNWWALGAEAAIGYIMGDSVGIGTSNGSLDVVSTSLDISTSLVGAVGEALLSDSQISKLGLKSLGFQITNSITQKLRTEKSIENFLNKKDNIDDALDKLELEKLTNIGGFFGNIFGALPIYQYTKIKESTTNTIIDGVEYDYTWGNNETVLLGINNYTQSIDSRNEDELKLSKESLLGKTKKMFESGKIESLLTKTERDDNGKTVYKGSKYRSWTSINQYNKLSSLIRPFTGDNLDKLKKTLSPVRPGYDSLEKYGVLQDNGFVKIAPNDEDTNKFNNKEQRDVKKYMFSIENLAWKDSIDKIIEGTSQEGPNGGRMMWFPPYDISFNETTSVNWNSDTFIGRGEPIYTYNNTERNGTLNFKVIVDHPSIINYYNDKNNKDINGNVIVDEDYLRFFVGDNVLQLKEDIINDSIKSIEEKKPEPPKTKIISFKVYFPNNYSGENLTTTNAINYLYSGKNCEITGGNGYEMGLGDDKGLTSFDITGSCCGNFYHKVDDELSTETMTNPNNYKDIISFELNSKKDNNETYSFKEVYESLSGQTNSDIYKNITSAKIIEIIGSASSQGNEEKNKKLAENRAKTIKRWLSLFVKEKNNTTLQPMVNEQNKLVRKGFGRQEDISIYKTGSIVSEKIINTGLTNDKEAKKDRYVLVKITIPNEIETVSTGDVIKNTEIINAETETQKEVNTTHNRIEKSMYGYNNKSNKLKYDESLFFKKITDTEVGGIIKGKLSEKIKYFHPAFHSTTPEGFNSRLTFLHQCTRQGPTNSSGDEKNSAYNMSFGRPPICILRIGDFYNTKVVFESLNIDFDPLVWDLNQEGIGVQPMIATISMNFKFIGGSDLTGPIARLQNAVTFNFFANTGVYDNRNDRLTSLSTTGSTYDKLYIPGIEKNKSV